MSALFKVMRQKVVGLVRVEAKLSIKERECQQWQLLFDIKGWGSYIVGKAGANTMFWSKNDSERVLCYPEEMVAQIDKWIEASSKPQYAIVVDKKRVATVNSSAEALKHKAPIGAYIFKIDNGIKTKIFKRTQSLMGVTWKPLKN